MSSPGSSTSSDVTTSTKVTAATELWAAPSLNQISDLRRTQDQIRMSVLMQACGITGSLLGTFTFLPLPLLLGGGVLGYGMAGFTYFTAGKLAVASRIRHVTEMRLLTPGASDAAGKEVVVDAVSGRRVRLQLILDEAMRVDLELVDPDDPEWAEEETVKDSPPFSDLVRLEVIHLDRSNGTVLHQALLDAILFTNKVIRSESLRSVDPLFIAPEKHFSIVTKDQLEKIGDITINPYTPLDGLNRIGSIALKRGRGSLGMGVFLLFLPVGMPLVVSNVYH